MEFITLNNGIKMPALGFGVFQIANDETCVQAVKDAIEVGFRLIDTAQSYGNEEAVGQAIQESSVKREDLFITTKVWVSHAGYQPAKESLLESLRKLQLDYIDLVLIHQPYGDYYGTYRAMQELYIAGKIKAIGVSNFYPDRLSDMAIYNDVIPAVNQIEVNPFYQQQFAQDINEKYAVTVQAWAPFAEGKNDMFEHETLKNIGHKYKKSVAQVILRWLIQRGISPLAKSTHRHRMQENFDIFDFILSSEDIELISSLDRNKSSFFSHTDPHMVETIAQLRRP